MLNITLYPFLLKIAIAVTSPFATRDMASDSVKS